MSQDSETTGYLIGQLLVAMPQMQDPRFMRTVIYMCAHSTEGAMGLVVNKLVDNVSFPDLLEQLNIQTGPVENEIFVHFGGPVDAGRGFVLHSSDYVQDATLLIDEHIGLTGTVDIVKSIAEGSGPDRSLLALGYAGWGAGQLDEEIQANRWLSVAPDVPLVFDGDLDGKWERAMGKMGIDFSKLSGDAGHA